MGLPKQVEQQLLEVAEIERVMQPEQQPDTANNGSPATETADVVQLKPAEEDWQQMYRTLEGKYNAEVPRLHGQVKVLTDKIDDLVGKLSAPAAAATPEPEAYVPLVTAEDEEAFGSDTIEMQRKVARDVMREYVVPLQNELKLRDAKIASLEQAQAQTGGEIASFSFEQQLAKTVPNFAQVNVDPKWIAWLNEIDPLTGDPRRVYAEGVYQAGNIQRIKALVDLFTGQQTTGTQDSRQTELNRQVQPSRTASSSSVAPAADRIYTEAEMGRLFNKVRQLNIAGKLDEAAKLDTELSLAYTQGRVRG